LTWNFQSPENPTGRLVAFLLPFVSCSRLSKISLKIVSKPKPPAGGFGSKNFRPWITRQAGGRRDRL